MSDQDQTMHVDRATVDGLVHLARELSRTHDLPTALSMYFKAISELAGFGSVVINLVIETGELQVVAAVGPLGLRETLLGTIESREAWDVMLEDCEVHGAVHLDYSHNDNSGMAVWKSEDEAWFARTAGEPDAWHPDFGVLVRMVDPDGDLIGVVSLDMPESGLKPNVTQLTTLEVLTRQVEAAIVSARDLARTALGEHIYSTIFQTAVSPMCIVNSAGLVTQTNRRFDDVFGETADIAAFDSRLAEVEQATGLVEQVAAVFKGPEGERTFVIGVGAAVERRWFHVSVRGVAYSKAVPVRVVCVLTEITSERRLRDQYQHDAEHDPLTGLLNRRGFSESLPRFADMVPPGDRYVAMFCDLDDFKAANDVHGHTFGDGVLVEVAQRLRLAAPHPAILGRFGGDEFAILTHASSKRDAEELAAAVIRVVGTDLPGGGRRAGDGERRSGSRDVRSRKRSRQPVAGRRQRLDPRQGGRQGPLGDGLKPEALLDYRVGLDLHEKHRVYQSADLDHRRCGANRAEEITVGTSDFLPSADVSHVHTSSDYIVEFRASAFERGLDTTQRLAGLLPDIITADCASAVDGRSRSSNRH